MFMDVLIPLPTNILSDIFFRHFYWWMKPEYLEKTTHLMQVIDHFYNVKLYRVQLAMGNNNQDSYIRC